MRRIIAILLLLVLLAGSALADQMYILSKGEVNVRKSPSTRSEVVGRFWCGYQVETDGQEKHGFAHVVGLSIENGEGWIYKGLLIEEPPMIIEGKCQICSECRVAARKYVNGSKIKWLKPGREVTIYAVGQTWAITNQGYVKTEFLSINYQIPQQKDGD